MAGSGFPNAGVGDTGVAASGRQPAQPDRHATGRRANAYPQRPVVSGHRASVAPQRGGHRERHPSHGAAGPTGMAAILDRIRASPVVHADATGWRQHGANGYVWTFSTPTERYFLRRGRGKTVVDEALSDAFSGVLVSDCYATTIMMAPSSVAGPTPVQARGRLCCGTSTTSAPATPMIRHWPGGPTLSTGFTTGPKPALIPQAKRRRTAQLALDNCWPSANPYGTTRRPPRPNCADASSATAKNSSSSWPNPQCLQTTTPLNAAGATWSSVARSAAAPARSKAHRAR